ncbi:hypothetical protein NBRC10512_004787 [Rhodotorula toruloides]|uniref:Uncharacterized protein n=1 Tax=Rhodotorula toruloides (strain NP11) TaxID=1130832 RepID=M7WYW6_RHOT1|nr:uncharacterized protein RHTO_00240 [Rhodotorula toruloides NP11]EMS25812.1 hypothetical protein RHTO_00240 [Rhodotorula toruloides NP11]
MAVKRGTQVCFGVVIPSSTSTSPRRPKCSGNSSSSATANRTAVGRSETPSTSPEPGVKKEEEVGADDGSAEPDGRQTHQKGLADKLAKTVILLGLADRSDRTLRWMPSKLEETRLQNLASTQERLATYGSLRLCLLPEKNLGCRSPGRAFVTCDDAEYDINARYTVYVRVSKTARERWQPYGVYKYLWHSFALADDYTRLDDRPDLQEDIIKVFLNYLQRNDIFARWVFENVSLDGTSDETTRYERYVALQAALEEEKRAIIERCLRAGEGLQMFWGVLVWDGPVRQDELRDIMTRRDERRAEEAVEE